jgi:A/G-specific adenine glycosylase
MKKQKTKADLTWFSLALCSWYVSNKRNLPWRNTKDPYLIWLSEIILQQTRVEQGRSYYYKFAENYPTVQQLAAAPEDEVLKLWQGLGYYSRARNLHSAAQLIVAYHAGHFPNDYEKILELKGVGTYTAAAIVSFAYNLPYAVVDGNVYRVLARIFGIDTPIDSSKGKKQFLDLAQNLISKNNAAEHNQAIMEFGALQCKPVNPDCVICPINNRCKAFEYGTVGQLPLKKKKTKVSARYFHYLLIENKNQVLIHKRTQKDIWQNLYDFPLIETAVDTDVKALLQANSFKAMIAKTTCQVLAVSEMYKHVLSHQHLHVRFYRIRLSKPLTKLKLENALVIAKDELLQYAVPRLIERYLEKEYNK